MGGGVGGKDVFYGFSSAKNTMFLKLFRSNGKEGTLSTDQLMRPGSLLQSRQSFSTGPEGGVVCTAKVPRLWFFIQLLTQSSSSPILWRGETQREVCKPTLSIPLI